MLNECGHGVPDLYARMAFPGAVKADRCPGFLPSLVRPEALSGPHTIQGTGKGQKATSSP
eukprot:4517573-Heterocapsa_arctica.AAC.1